LVTTRRKRCPYELGAAGTAWWKWAWKTPQAEGWDDGALYTVARRAQLEDERAAIEIADEDDLIATLLEGAEPEAIRRVQYALQRLSASATGSATLSREMREIEKQLGLGPKAAKELGVKPKSPAQPTKNPVNEIADRRAARQKRASRAAGSPRS
jgi:hypothetical protein